MQIASPIRANLMLLGLAGPAFAQAIPPAAPTAVQPAAQPTTATLPPISVISGAPPPLPGPAARRARVDFATGLVTVTADNSSLNQILRDIGRATGMKITGGVTDERVYGTYGPADTGTILATLLRGTGSNMLLIFDPSQAPRELVLTPRLGGVTPPNPATTRDEPEENDLPPQRQQHFTRPVGVPSEQPPQQQPPVPPTAAPATSPEAPPAAAPSADTTTQESPNGVKTPQQIYDQLMKLQQQQQKPTAAAPPQ